MLAADVDAGYTAMSLEMHNPLVCLKEEGQGHCRALGAFTMGPSLYCVILVSLIEEEVQLEGLESKIGPSLYKLTEITGP